MATTTTQTQQDYTQTAEVDDHVMFQRDGFDEKQIRYDLANAQPIALDDKFVERNGQTFIDPRTLDMPEGPTGLGEVGGSGVEEIKIDGERWPTHRWVQGFSVLEEDTNDVSQQREATLEMLQFFADVSFMHGLGPSGQYADGMLNYLKSNVPSDRTIDCSTYTSEYEGREQQVINYDAIAALDGDRLNVGTDGWDLAMGTHGALTNLRKSSSTADTYETTETYWSKIADDLVGSRYKLPYEQQPTTLPRDLENQVSSTVDELMDDLTFTVAEQGSSDGSNLVDDNELFLMPDMDTVRSEFWRTYEMAAPDVDQTTMRGKKRAFDYIWRYTHKFNPSGQYGELPGVVRLTNVDALFD